MVPSWLANKCSHFGYGFHIVYVGCCLTEDINFTARRQPGQARSPPPAPVLTTPEPRHCCEVPDRTPSIQVAGNSSQGLSDSQPKARNSGRLKKHVENRQLTHFNHHEQPSTLQRLHLHGKLTCRLAYATNRSQLPCSLIFQMDPLPYPQAGWEKREFTFIHVLLSQLSIAVNTSNWCRAMH